MIVQSRLFFIKSIGLLYLFIYFCVLYLDRLGIVY